MRSAQRAARRRYRKVTVMAGIFCIVLTAVMFVGMMHFREKNKAYSVAQAELASQIEEQKERADKLDSYSSYVQSDTYVRETAKEKLGLMDPGEIIFRPQD